jgi:high frequency lysogenization protein
MSSSAYSSSHLTPLNQRVTALAALMQAVYLVDCIARKGLADAEDFRVMTDSIFADPSANHSVANLYGGIAYLNTGLRLSIKILSGDPLPQTKALMAYSASLLSLELRLSRNKDIHRKLVDGMIRIGKQRQYFGDAAHTNIVAAIAELYGETISTIKPRIIVRGKSEYLSQNVNTQRVRTLLMAGLRAAHIWHKHGGGHLSLLIRRKILLHELEQLQKTAIAIDQG